MNSIVNPFYQLRPQKAKYALALLPVAPVNSSPVPHLTSLYHNPLAGNYGDRRYPGNCEGNLIKDLLTYFEPASVLDPMTGSGTCKDVCKELDIPVLSADIRYGFDACSASHYPQHRKFDFVWLHPPYWRQKRYSLDPRDLSQANTLDTFLERYRQLIENCAGVLSPHGKLAILMGDYTDNRAGFVPLTYHTKAIAFEAGLKQVCTDIIRFSHGASSSSKVYHTRFIPGLHDTCMVFSREW